MCATIPIIHGFRSLATPKNIDNILMHTDGEDGKLCYANKFRINKVFRWYTVCIYRRCETKGHTNLILRFTPRAYSKTYNQGREEI